MIINTVQNDWNYSEAQILNATAARNAAMQQAHCPECKVSLGDLRATHWSFCRYLAKQARAMNNAMESCWAANASQDQYPEPQARTEYATPISIEESRRYQAMASAQSRLAWDELACGTIRAAVEAEREECAKIAEDVNTKPWNSQQNIPQMVATAIRARGNK